MRVETQTDYKTCPGMFSLHLQTIVFFTTLTPLTGIQNLIFLSGLGQYRFVQTATTRQKFKEIYFFGLI